VEVRDVEALLLQEHDWQRLSMSEGTKGPRLFDWACVPILHRWEDDGQHFLLIRRSLSDPKEKRYHFVFAPKGSTLHEIVRASGARWHIEEDLENAKDLGLDHDARAVLHRLVPTHHAGAVGSCRLSRDLCARALLHLFHLCSCSLSAFPSTCHACPERPRSAPSAGTTHLARFFICLPGPGLVVVASLPSKSCQLFPYQTSSRGWLILAGSQGPALGFLLSSTHVPDIPEISWKCWSSWKSVADGLSSTFSAKGVLCMTLLPVADGARLLGIHPKTLRHWLTTAHLPLVAHPTDARIRCVAQEALLEMASLHSRPLPDLSAVATLEKDPVSGGAAASAHGVSAVSLADLLQQLSQLHTQLATVQHHLTGLTLAVLHEQTDGASALAPSSPLAPRPASRLLPVEVRARSRVTALIEYDAHGQYVTVCPKLGVLALVPDSPEWFDWLASLTSFRGCRAQQGAFRRVAPPRKGSTRAGGLPGACFMGTTAGTLLGSLTA
jgi:hypothetical protein